MRIKRSVNALKKMIGEFESEEVQLKFIAECGQFFAEASNVEEAIQNGATAVMLDLAGDE